MAYLLVSKLGFASGGRSVPFRSVSRRAGKTDVQDGRAGRTGWTDRFPEPASGIQEEAKPTKVTNEQERVEATLAKSCEEEAPVGL